jgi:hypothetical protein
MHTRVYNDISYLHYYQHSPYISAIISPSSGRTLSYAQNTHENVCYFKSHVETNGF